MSRLQELMRELCPDGVEYRALGDCLAPVENAMIDGPFGSNLKRENYIDEPEVRIVQLGNIGEGGWVDDSKKYTSFEHLNTIRRHEVFPGEIVIAKMMPAGRAIILPDLGTRCVLSSDAIRFVPDPSIDTRYMLYAINSPAIRQKISDDAHGATRVRTSIKKLKSYRIPVPPIEVQREVVRILDEYTAAHDELVRQLEEEMRLCELQLTIARNELLTFSERERVRWTTLGEITLEVITPIRAKPTDFTGDIPWCKLEDVIGRSIGKSLSGKGVSRDTIAQMHLNITPKGSLLCSCSATLGVYAIAETDLVTNQRFVGFVLSKEVCKEYVLHYLRFATPMLSNKATGSTNAYISRRKFESLPIPLPPLETQEDYARMLNSLEDELQSLSEVLTLEMQGRASQLTLLRNQLLSFPEKVA